MTERLTLRNIMLFVGFMIILAFAGVWAYQMITERGSNGAQTTRIHKVLSEPQNDLVEKIDETEYANYQQ